ncbi:DUF5447 family protein [Pseudomonas sp.]|uniref:lysogeny maintenance protein PflM n=1 Tax=Pseudomonas sp. TaxID=306 RepID=UPI00273755BF|nr:DUF5447 family protein [Pseudomonas sp.]MDP2748633.1 DUF5447 family protein [Pseudomonas sp.]
MNCDCSVCWSKHQLSFTASRSEPCTQCRPAQVSKVDGRLLVVPASYCAKHTPSDRPPRYWHVYSDTGKPTPCVPLREPFNLE